MVFLGSFTISSVHRRECRLYKHKFPRDSLQLSALRCPTKCNCTLMSTMYFSDSSKVYLKQVHFTIKSLMYTQTIYKYLSNALVCTQTTYPNFHSNSSVYSKDIQFSNQDSSIHQFFKLITVHSDDVHQLLKGSSYRSNFQHLTVKLSSVRLNCDKC